MDHTRREISLTLVPASVPLQPATPLSAATEQTGTSLGLSLSPVLIAVADLARRVGAAPIDIDRLKRPALRLEREAQSAGRRKSALRVMGEAI